MLAGKTKKVAQSMAGLRLFADHFQVRTKGMEKPYLGACPASPREYLLRRKS